MTSGLEHFTAIGLFVGLGFILIYNSIFHTRGFQLFDKYDPRLWPTIAAAVAFVVGGLIEDTFDSVAPDYLDEEEAQFWQPLETNAFNPGITEPKLNNYQEFIKYLIPSPKEEIRFRALFGEDAAAAHRSKTTYIKWDDNAKKYVDLNLFSNLISPEANFHDLYTEIILAIRQDRRIRSDQLRNTSIGLCTRVRSTCYHSIAFNRYLKTFVNNIYINSRFSISERKFYSDEIKNDEQNASFTRTICYISLGFLFVMIAIIGIKVAIWAFLKITASIGDDVKLSDGSTFYLIIPTVFFFFLATLARNAYEFEQIQLNSRVFGYTTSLAVLAQKSGGENAIGRSFLGTDPDGGSPESDNKRSGM